MLLVPGALAVMLQPWVRPPSLHAFDFQRWVETAGLTLLTVLFLPYAGATLYRKPRVAFFVFFFAFLLCVSIWVSTAPILLSVSVFRMVLYSIVFIGFVSVWQECGNQKKTLFAVLLVLVLATYCLYLIVGTLSLVAFGVYDRTIAVFGFSNVNHAAGFMMLSLLLLPGTISLLPSRGKAFVGVARVVGITFVFMLAVIGSRGALLASLVAGAVLMFFHEKKVVDQCLRWLLETFAIGLSIYLVFTVAAIELEIDLWVGNKQLIADSGRFQLYLAAWTGALDSPWLGNGPLSYASLPNITLGHAHNVLLTLLFEFGFLITLLLVALVFWLGCILLERRAVIIESPVTVSGVAALLGFAVHAQFSGLLMIPATMFMVLVAGAFLAGPIMAPLPTVRASSATIFATMLGAVLVTLYLLLVSQYWQAVNSDVSQKPRFWLHGGTEIWYSSEH
ncbi:O-antigen ligase family protein [Alloalcanivorax venustensis]|uniref:O-antigen ligase family protein n=1 Tax=Alloalcanivorax venustensis TaxID=172371 RepID=UPI003514609B